MICLIKENKEKIVLNTVEELSSKLAKNSWIHLTKPTEEMVCKVCEATGLDKKRMIEALDPEETAHVDFDGDNLITIDIPVWNENVCETIPFIIMYSQDYYVTIANMETDLLDQALLKVKKLDIRKKNQLSIYVMYRVTAMYISSLKKIDKERHLLEEKIKTSTRNKEIFDLMDLNKSLIYLSTSLNSNKNAFYKLGKIAEFRKYEEDNDLMDDVITENNQAIEMCSIYREILDGMMNAFASITSNNLNIVMKLLAIITLVISLPTLISSIYGMNVEGLPFATKKGAFWIILAFASIFAVLGAFILIRFTDYSIKQRKSFNEKKDKGDVK